MAAVQGKPLLDVPRDKVSLDEELIWIRKGPPAQKERPGDDSPYVSYVQPETFSEKAWRKTQANPLVPLGVIATTAALTFGLWAMRRGDQKMSQYMMRARVGGQFFTIVALVGGVYLAGSRAK